MTGTMKTIKHQENPYNQLSFKYPCLTKNVLSCCEFCCRNYILKSRGRLMSSNVTQIEYKYFMKFENDRN